MYIELLVSTFNDLGEQFFLVEKFEYPSHEDESIFNVRIQGITDITYKDNEEEEIKNRLKTMKMKLTDATHIKRLGKIGIEREYYASVLYHLVLPYNKIMKLLTLPVDKRENMALVSLEELLTNGKRNILVSYARASYLLSEKKEWLDIHV